MRISVHKALRLGPGEVYPHKRPGASLRVSPVGDDKLLLSLWRTERRARLSQRQRLVLKGL
jgi:hypothetical protein